MTNETTRTPAIDATTDTNALTVTLAFSNGETLVIDATQLSRDIQAQATLHGLKQKLVDAAAISRNPDTGRTASVDDKYNAVREVYDRLLSGSWNKVRDGGAGNGAGGLLFRAMQIAYPAKSAEAIREYLAAKSPAECAEMRKTTKLAAIIATLRTAPQADDSILPDWE